MPRTEQEHYDDGIVEARIGEGLVGAVVVDRFAVRVREVVDPPYLVTLLLVDRADGRGDEGVCGRSVEWASDAAGLNLPLNVGSNSIRVIRRAREVMADSTRCSVSAGPR